MFYSGVTVDFEDGDRLDLDVEIDDSGDVTVTDSNGDVISLTETEEAQIRRTIREMYDE